MSDDREGIELLRSTLEEVEASLPARSYPTPAVGPLAAEASPRPSPVAALLDFRAWMASPRPAFAAAVVFALMAYPAYLGLVRLPSARAERAAGPVELHLVSPPRAGVRSLGSEPDVTLGTAESAVLLLELDPEWLTGEGSDSLWLFELRDAAGREVRSWKLTQPQLRRLLETSDGVPLLLHGSEIGKGSFELRLRRQGGAGDEELATINLRVSEP